MLVLPLKKAPAGAAFQTGNRRIGFNSIGTEWLQLPAVAVVAAARPGHGIEDASRRHPCVIDSVQARCSAAGPR